MRLLAVLFVLADQPGTMCDPQFAPLATGTSAGTDPLEFWRKSEAGDWGGSGWLGWGGGRRTITSEREDQLQPVEMIVRDRPKDFPNDDENVTVQAVPDVTFAVRCIPQLQAGSIQTLRDGHGSLEYDGPRNLALGARRYRLYLESKRPDRADARVILTDGRRTQVLYSADGFVDEPHYDIIWAGDLDRDGELDLVVNLHRKYSWHPYRLLLSSIAPEGQLVGDAALFETGD